MFIQPSSAQERALVMSSAERNPQEISWSVSLDKAGLILSESLNDQTIARVRHEIACEFRVRECGPDPDPAKGPGQAFRNTKPVPTRDGRFHHTNDTLSYLRYSRLFNAFIRLI